MDVLTLSRIQFGATIAFHADSGIVRKTAAAPAANARLLAQAEKQRRLFMLGLPFPRIVADRINAKGCAEFDMQYLPGRSLADAVSQAASFDSAMIARSVERMMWLFAPHAGEALAAHLFHDKIHAIAAKAGDAVREAAGRLSALDWSGIPESPCHGDLTLENMLITTAKTVAFIDCDEAWVSSYWLDFGKLFQDIDGHWCLRRLYGPQCPQAQRVNAIQKLEPLGRAFRALAERTDPALTARLPQLAALGLLRAIPYARDETAIAFICRRITTLLDTGP